MEFAGQYGTGFRNRVADLLQGWFIEPEHTELLEVLEAHVQPEWEEQVIAKFRELCTPTEAVAAAS